MRNGIVKYVMPVVMAFGFNSYIHAVDEVNCRAPVECEGLIGKEFYNDFLEQSAAADEPSPRFSLIAFPEDFPFQISYSHTGITLCQKSSATAVSRQLSSYPNGYQETNKSCGRSWFYKVRKFKQDGKAQRVEAGVVTKQYEFTAEVAVGGEIEVGAEGGIPGLTKVSGKVTARSELTVGGTYIYTVEVKQYLWTQSYTPIIDPTEGEESTSCGDQLAGGEKCEEH